MYMKTKFCLLISSLIILGLQVLIAQQTTISGKITDSETGEFIVGANIIVKGASRGVTSDFDGNFSISANTSDILVFSYIGFTSQEILIGSNLSINVALVPDVSELDEVILVGYGTQRKKDLTGSVSVISPERLEEKTNTNFRQALQGSLPGITINTNTANAEGNNVGILIRGRNSISASNSPLVVYDGIPYSGSISDINPSDIKSITILKDASSTAIYGSRGSNGVILIETKKGVSSKPIISYSGYSGVNEIAHIPEVYQGQGFAGFKEVREPGELTQTEIDNLMAGKTTNWLDLATRSAQKQEHNISVSGASKNANYYISLGYQDVQGIAINDKFQRATLRTNVSFNINENIKFGTNTQLSYIDRSGLSPSFSSNAAGAYFTNPLTNAYNPDGSLTLYPWPEEQYFTNPLAPTLADNSNINNKIFTANYIEIKTPFIPGLSYKLNTGVEYSNRNERTYWGRDTARGNLVNGEAIVENIVNENFLIEHILNYKKTFGKHNINFTGLYSAQKITYEKHETVGKGFSSDVLTYFQMNLATLPKEVSQSFDQETLISQMGRLNYNFDDKYLATFTLRRDGYTGFGDNNKYGVFPSAGFSWNVSNESFFPENNVVNNLRFRLTYGESGNQDISSVANLARLDDLSYLDGDVTAPGYIPLVLGNNNLTWETTATYNIGIDMGLLNNRFQISLDAYQSESSDLLLNKLIPSVQGIRRIIDNVANTKNFGVEAAISGFIMDTKDFKWSANSNFSYNKNEIVSLQGGDEDDVANRLFIGQPIRINYGLKFDGIWQTGQDTSGSAQPDAIPGDVKVLDANGDLTISSDDRVFLGQRDPKFTWGLTNTFKYKNFSLDVFIHGVEGVTKRNTTRSTNVFGGVQRNTFVQDFWSVENPINSFYRNDGIVRANVHGVQFYESADFVRIKDITLSYKLDDSLFKLNNIDLKVYLTARNLFTITNWSGLDPELDSQFGAPLQKEFVFGMNIKL